MTANIERAARERVKQMIHDARELKLQTSGKARFFERERIRHGQRELRERGDSVDK